MTGLSNAVSSIKIALAVALGSSLSLKSHSSSGSLAPVINGMSLFRSAPEQKALSPVPVTITTRTAGLALISFYRVARRTMTSGLKQLPVEDGPGPRGRSISVFAEDDRL